MEIGGAFRIPDVMRRAGCQLQEVGTTNRTHAKDYRRAVNDNTALLMKVHSNYSIEGFTKAVDEAELAAIGRELDVPVVADRAAGRWWISVSMACQRADAAGDDRRRGELVSFSGDKLLGGPQAGIIVGKRALIAQLQSHPLKRALRADKMTLAALEATLRLYQHPEALRRNCRRCACSPSGGEIRRLAERLQPDLAAHYADLPSAWQPASRRLAAARYPSTACPARR